MQHLVTLGYKTNLFGDKKIQHVTVP